MTCWALTLGESIPSWAEALLVGLVLALNLQRQDCSEIINLGRLHIYTRKSENLRRGAMLEQASDELLM